MSQQVKYYWGIEQGSAEWFAIRADLYTASNFLAVLKGRAKKNTARSSHGGFWAERGKILEAQASILYQRITGIELDFPAFITNKLYPNAGYSPDGVNKDKTRLVEIKCFKREKHQSINTIEDIPTEVIAQCLGGMMIAEIDTIDLVLYNPEDTAKNAFKIITLTTNKKIKKIQDNIKNKLKELE